MRRMSLVLVWINLCLAMAYVAVILPPAAAFADEPAPDANPCYLECKQECYDHYAEMQLWCPEHPEWPNCLEDQYYELQSCKSGCSTNNTCPNGGM